MVACVLRVSPLPPLSSLPPCSDITALQANNDTRPFAASYIRAQKLRFNLFGFRTPEFEFQWNGTSRVEIYYNRFITLNEFQVGPSARAAAVMCRSIFGPNLLDLSLSKPLSPLVLFGRFEALHVWSKLRPR